MRRRSALGSGKQRKMGKRSFVMRWSGREIRCFFIARSQMEGSPKLGASLQGHFAIGLQSLGKSSGIDSAQNSGTGREKWKISADRRSARTSSHPLGASGMALAGSLSLSTSRLTLISPLTIKIMRRGVIGSHCESPGKSPAQNNNTHVHIVCKQGKAPGLRVGIVQVWGAFSRGYLQLE